MPSPDARTCAICGRTIDSRTKSERDVEEVSYCSDSCRAHELTTIDRALESAILELLDARDRGKTICPSEAARLVSPGDWEGLMAKTRAAARRLAAHQEIVITQRGAIVDPSRARGAIRLKRRG